MLPKKVLIVHVPYQIRGGEDIYAKELGEIYQKIGLAVEYYPADRTAPKNSLLATLRALLPGSTLPNFQMQYEKFRPDFLHLNNIHPILGPCFLRWIKKNKVFAVMTIHNHRFFCTNGLALRKNKICKDCFRSKFLWRSILFNCNGSLVKTLYHAMALSQIRLTNLLDGAIKIFIAPSLYIEEELLRYGIAKKKITYIMHASHDSQIRFLKNEYDVVYAGRLSQEKGIDVLLECTKILSDVKFLIVGSGPMEDRVRTVVQEQNNLTYVGQKTLSETQQLIARAKISVLPSICNEILSIFIVDSLYQGKHCVVSDTESSQWMKQQKMPVMLAKAGDAADFSRAIRELLLAPNISLEKKNEIQKKLAPTLFMERMQGLIASIPPVSTN